MEMTVTRARSNVEPGRAARLAAAGIVLPAVLASGCSDEPNDDPAQTEPAEEVANELPTLAHMGEIRVAVQPRPDDVLATPQLEIDARFVEYRDIAADEAASRAGLTPVASDILRPGQCMSTAELNRFAATDGEERDPSFESADEPGVGNDPEVLLVDAGDVRVALGEREFVVPLALVPDLVPWVSGVEYVYSGDELPRSLFAPDGTAPADIEIDGAVEAGLPPLITRVELPRSFVLRPVFDASADGSLALVWEPSEAGDERMILELTAYADGDPSGTQVTCVVPDAGAATLPLSALEQAGLGNGETVAVTARRIDVTHIDAGAFRRVRVVAEVRDRQLLAMPE